MKFNPKIHHRRSIRMKGYDYASAGVYFVTIVTYQRECLFGEIVDGEMRLNEYGKIVEHAWKDLVNYYPNIELGSFCIMLTGLLFLIDPTVGAVGAGLRPAPTAPTTPKHHGLPEIIRAYKSFSARHVNEYLKSPGVHPWQRNYYEHIIRNDDEFNRIRLYIESNPSTWNGDKENPAAVKK